MPVIVHTDYLLQVSGAGLVAVPGVWVRLLNNSTATNYYSTAVTTSTGAFTHSAVPGDYSAFYGTAATVPGTPTLANAHWAVPVTAGDDAVLGSATLVVSSPYTALLADGTTATPAGVDWGTIWDYGGAAYNIAAGGATAALTDNQAKISAVITKCMTSGRGAVFVPPGTFKYASPIVNAVDGLVMLGAGLSASVLRYTGTGASTAFDCHGTNFCVLKDIGFDYNSGTFTGRLVDIGRGSLSKAEGCSFGSAFGTTIRSADCGLAISNSVNPVVDACLFDGAQYGIRCGEEVNGYTQGMLVIGCDFNNTRMQALAHLRNPGNGKVIACNFENLADGTVRACSMATTITTTKGLSFEGCWNADIWNFAIPTAAAAAGATPLQAGTYNISYSYVVGGVESLLSPPVTVALTAGQQINVGTVPFTNVAVGDQIINPTAVKWYFITAPGGTNGFIVSNANGNAFSITAYGNGVANTIGTFGIFEVWGNGIKVTGNQLAGSSSSNNNTAAVRTSNGAVNGLEVTYNDLTQFQSVVVDLGVADDFITIEHNQYNLVATIMGANVPLTTGRIQLPNSGFWEFAQMNGTTPIGTKGLGFGHAFTAAKEVDWFQLDSTATRTFAWYQKTGASTQALLMYLDNSGFLTLNNGASLGGNSSINGKFTTYQGIATAGIGLPAIYGAPTIFTGQTAAKNPVTTLTSPNDAAKHVYEITGTVTITTLGSAVINLEVTYTDDNGTARTCIIPLCAEAGTFATAANTADAWKGHVVIAVNPNTAVTILTAGTFTGGTYNVSGQIKQLL